MVVGTLTHKQAPILLKVYEQMCEPEVGDGVRRVRAPAAASTRTTPTVPGIDKIIPVDIYVPGCPPRPETVIDGHHACCRTGSRGREHLDHQRRASDAMSTPVVRLSCDSGSRR